METDCKSTSKLIILRGGGDIATGAAQAFYRAGLPLLILESERPTAIRRTVALCEAVYDGTCKVEDVPARRIMSLREIAACHEKGEVPVLADPEGRSIAKLRPAAVADAILAKRNLGTNRAMAPITIALGPGFAAGRDVDVVVETMRGHDLGRLVFKGCAKPNTGIPGEIGGRAAERVLKAPCAGLVRHLSYRIGDVVKRGEPVLLIEGKPVTAPFTGLLRGLIREGLMVCEGTKVGDIDPRTGTDWRTISDKARCVGGAALEAYLLLSRRG